MAFGHYLFIRLTSGLVSAGDIFSFKVDGLFKGIPGIYPVMDDLKVQVNTKVEHDMDILKTCKLALQNGLRLNPINVW